MSNTILNAYKKIYIKENALTGSVGDPIKNAAIALLNAINPNASANNDSVDALVKFAKDIASKPASHEVARAIDSIPHSTT